MSTQDPEQRAWKFLSTSKVSETIRGQILTLVGCKWDLEELIKAIKTLYPDTKPDGQKNSATRDPAGGKNHHLRPPFKKGGYSSGYSSKGGKGSSSSSSSSRAYVADAVEEPPEEEYGEEPEADALATEATEEVVEEEWAADDDFPQILENFGRSLHSYSEEAQGSDVGSWFHQETRWCQSF